jgi:hypothetical protein
MKAKCAFSGGVLVLLAVCTSSGLTIRVQDAFPNELPQYLLVADGSATLDIILEIENEQSVDSPPIVVWQLGLHVSQGEGAFGDVVIQSLATPDGSLFGADPGPIAFDELPLSDVVISDADTIQFTGVSIPAQSTIPIASLSLQEAGAVSGEFILWCAPFDIDNIDGSSYWANAEDFEPTPFENQPNPLQRLELASIQVIGSQPLLGDFNDDNNVNAADYTVWRNNFGAVEGDLLHGNGNGGSIGEADYTLWKSHFGDTRQGSTAITVPEPASLILLCMICHAASIRERRQRCPTAARKVPPVSAHAEKRAGEVVPARSLPPDHQKRVSTTRFH